MLSPLTSRLRMISWRLASTSTPTCLRFLPLILASSRTSSIHSTSTSAPTSTSTLRIERSRVHWIWAKLQYFMPCIRRRARGKKAMHTNDIQLKEGKIHPCLDLHCSCRNHTNNSAESVFSNAKCPKWFLSPGCRKVQHRNQKLQKRRKPKANRKKRTR
jgi:hypothetical protein